MQCCQTLLRGARSKERETSKDGSPTQKQGKRAMRNWSPLACKNCQRHRPEGDSSTTGPKVSGGDPRPGAVPIDGQKPGDGKVPKLVIVVETINGCNTYDGTADEPLLKFEDCVIQAKTGKLQTMNGNGNLNPDVTITKAIKAVLPKGFAGDNPGLKPYSRGGRPSANLGRCGDHFPPCQEGMVPLTVVLALGLRSTSVSTGPISQ